MKNEVLCQYFQSLFSDYKVKAEFSTNQNDLKIITVQEQPGQKIVFYGDIDPLFNYYEVVVYGDSIQDQKETINEIGALIGQNIIYNVTDGTYQIMFKQMQNPQAIEYMDIRRVGYQTILKTIISKIQNTSSI